MTTEEKDNYMERAQNLRGRYMPIAERNNEIFRFMNVGVARSISEEGKHLYWRAHGVLISENGIQISLPLDRIVKYLEANPEPV